MAVKQLADKRQITREEWLELRRQGLGGSDAAAVLGVNPYQSPLSLYYEKIKGIQKEESLAMELGRELEPFLRRKFCQWIKDEEGYEIQVDEAPFMMGSSDYPFLFANVDGTFNHPELGPCGLELKTAGEFQQKAWIEDEVPDHYYIQVQHYMAVTGLEHFYLGYLLGNRIFNAKLIPLNLKVIQDLVEELKKFWQDHIMAKVPPAPSGLDCDTGVLKLLYPEEEGNIIELSHCQDLYQSYQELKKEEKRVKVEMEAIKQHFMAEMKDAQVALVGRKKITWKMVERKGYTVPPSVSRVLRMG